MSKQSGLGDRLLIDGYNVSGDIASINDLHGGNAPFIVTGIDKSAIERIGGQRDGAVDFASFFNDGGGANRAGAAGSSMVLLSSLPATDRHIMYLRGTTLGNAGICLIGQQADCKASRGADGSMGFSVQAPANGYGIECGQQLTPGILTVTGAANGASIDLGAVSTLFGLTAYLQVTAFTGTDATITIADSANDSAYTAVTGGAFTQITAGPTKERIQTGLSATIRRYLRPQVTTSGGFTSLSYAIVVIRHLTAVAY